MHAPRRTRPTGLPESHRRLLQACGVSGPPLERLAHYLDTLAEWSRRVNLTGAQTPSERVGTLVEPILGLQTVPEPGSLLDVGSGNGSPGLVLALLRDDLQVTLLEPRTRRWAFLREASRRSGAANVQTLRVRHEGYEGPPARTLTVRALALPLPELAPLVLPGGRVLVLGGRPTLEGPFAEEGPLPCGPDTRVYRRLPVDVPRETPGRRG